MKEYTIKVDDKYFVGETMEPLRGTVGAGSRNFFGGVGENPHLFAYEFSERRGDAAEMIMFNALSYLQGIFDRTRYLPDAEKPSVITIEEVTNNDTSKV